LTDTLASFNSSNYFFAAHLLKTFLDRTSNTFAATNAEIDEIKNSGIYRTAALRSLSEKARTYAGQGLSGSIRMDTPTQFDGQYWNWFGRDERELFNALGGAHFSYTGTMCLSGNNWTADVKMTQTDRYSFDRTDSLGINGLRLVFPSYNAAHILETQFNYSPIIHTETWDDHFASNFYAR